MLARYRSRSISLLVTPYIYIHYSYYLVSIYRIASAINKVVYRNTYFAYLLTSKSYTQTVTALFSIDTLLILQTSPARSEPHSSFTYPVVVRSPIVTIYYKLIRYLNSTLFLSFKDLKFKEILNLNTF
jgi:hypothetical protein